MKKAQTLRAGGAKNFRTATDLFPGARDGKDRSYAERRVVKT